MYVYNADLWCDECGKEICERLENEGKAPDDPNDECSFDSDDYPKRASDDDESDSPSHCAAGEECLNHEILSDGRKVGCLLGGLTSEGVKYVIERATENDPKTGFMRNVPSPCVQLWIEHFDIALPALDSCTSLGGYPLIYLTKTGDCLCGSCAAVERGKGVQVTGDIYYEGSSLFCDECNTEIESAYGEADDDLEPEDNDRESDKEEST